MDEVVAAAAILNTASSAPTLATPATPVIAGPATGSTLVTGTSTPTRSVESLSSAAEKPVLETLLKVLTELVSLITRFLHSPGTSPGNPPLTPTTPLAPPASSATPAAPSSTSSSTATSTGATDRGTLPFREKVRELLRSDANESVSEERLQYGIISYQLYQKSAKLQENFRSAFEAARDDGLGVEEASKRALKQLYESKQLADWEVNWVYSLSSRAAQLDTSLESLAITSDEKIPFETALQRAELGLVGIQSGTIKVESKNLLA